jgi:DNA primase
LIKPETIQEIFETVRVDEVIGEFVSLKKRGVNMIGLCPFHNEKTPSFTVSPAKGIYKCFGCGKGGNAVNFIMDHEHYTYPEALKSLAKKYNIDIEEEEQTPEQLEYLNEQESLFHVSTFAQKYFTENLQKSEEGKAIGLSYLLDRGISEAMIEKFQLGYCIDKFEDFTKHALKEGYKQEYLEKTGLCIRKEDRVYDRFRGRVMFPIHNLTGRVIAFGGRILSAEKSKAKYVNSPESDIYNKSKVLYGIYQGRNAIISKDNCFLVEGYTDVISLHQAKIENVVSSSGTSLTTDQIKLIKRFTKNITILYDGDAAGIKASFRGIDMILEEGMNVKIILFPEGEDPDSYARNHRTEEIENFVQKNVKDFISFKTDLLMQDAKNDPLKRANLIKEIVQTISLIPDGIFRSVYVRECSAIMNIQEQTLMNELNKLLRKKYQDKYRRQSFESVEVPIESETQKIPETDTYSAETQEREIVRLLLLYGNQEIIFEELNELQQKIEVPIKIAEYIVHDLKNDEIELQNPEYRLIMNEYERALNQGFIPGENYFVQFKDQKVSKLSIDILSTPYELSENWERNKIFVKMEQDNLLNLVSSSVMSYKSKKLDQMILEHQKELKETKNEEDSLILMHKLINLKQMSIEINKQLSRIITK